MNRTIIAMAAIAAVTLPLAEAAAQPSQVATYRDWIVYTAPVGDDTVCYAVTEPTDKEPTTVNHGNIYFMVSTWKSGVAKNQPSFKSGYELRDRPEPLIRIGSDKWGMYTYNTESFIEATRDEERMVAAMRRGSEMRLSAMSKRGTATEYTFSLLGISSALDRAERACR